MKTPRFIYVNESMHPVTHLLKNKVTSDFIELHGMPFRICDDMYVEFWFIDKDEKYPTAEWEVVILG